MSDLLRFFRLINFLPGGRDGVPVRADLQPVHSAAGGSPLPGKNQSPLPQTRPGTRRYNNSATFKRKSCSPFPQTSSGTRRFNKYYQRLLKENHVDPFLKLAQELADMIILINDF